ncbi:hypothetical protein ACTXT7_005255 [Hymenolepis weldensis]
MALIMSLHNMTQFFPAFINFSNCVELLSPACGQLVLVELVAMLSQYIYVAAFRMIAEEYNKKRMSKIQRVTRFFKLNKI